MTRIITLLNEKNHYLEKFFALTEAELSNFVQGHFENLESFYQTRERILDILKYLDAQVEREQENLNGQMTIEDSQRQAVKQALAIKDEYVTRIIEQDIQVLACIETAKNLIIKELQDVRQNRKAVAGYKVNSFDKRLIEEV
jgi:hypothetical protein